MLSPDDERFERYLRQFRPLPPESLQTEKRGRATRRPFALAAGAAAVLVATVLTMSPRRKPAPSPRGAESLAGVEQLTNPRPLTIGSANELLAHAPSFKAAVDLVSFQSRATQLSEGMHSALAVLSKEKTNL